MAQGHHRGLDGIKLGKDVRAPLNETPNFRVKRWGKPPLRPPDSARWVGSVKVRQPRPARASLRGAVASSASGQARLFSQLLPGSGMVAPGSKPGILPHRCLGRSPPGPPAPWGKNPGTCLPGSSSPSSPFLSAKIFVAVPKVMEEYCVYPCGGALLFGRGLPFFLA